MNKLFVVIMACLTIASNICIKSQDTLKFHSNDWATELNFNPFNGTLTLNNATAQLKLRKFGPGNTALRLAFTFNYTKDNTSEDNKYGMSPTSNYDRKSSTMINLTVGKEKHFAGSRRISPYIGGEFGLGFKSSKHINKNNSNLTTVTGAWEIVQEYYNGSYYLTTSYTERGFWSVGGNLIAGFDFYMAKNFYMGYEILFGFDYTKYSNIDITHSGTSSSTNPTFDDESWRFGPKLQNGIRIGFVF